MGGGETRCEGQQIVDAYIRRRAAAQIVFVTESAAQKGRRKEVGRGMPEQEAGEVRGCGGGKGAPIVSHNRNTSTLFFHTLGPKAIRRGWARQYSGQTTHVQPRYCSGASSASTPVAMMSLAAHCYASAALHARVNHSQLHCFVMRQAAQHGRQRGPDDAQSKPSQSTTC
jgi:hypothetical protein